MAVAQAWDEMMGKQAENKRLTSSIYSRALYENYITKKYFRVAVEREVDVFFVVVLVVVREISRRRIYNVHGGTTQRHHRAPTHKNSFFPTLFILLSFYSYYSIHQICMLPRSSRKFIMGFSCHIAIGLLLSFYDYLPSSLFTGSARTSFFTSSSSGPPQIPTALFVYKC